MSRILNEAVDKDGLLRDVRLFTLQSELLRTLLKLPLIIFKSLATGGEAVPIFVVFFCAVH